MQQSNACSTWESTSLHHNTESKESVLPNTYLELCVGLLVEMHTTWFGSPWLSWFLSCTSPPVCRCPGLLPGHPHSWMWNRQSVSYPVAGSPILEMNKHQWSRSTSGKGLHEVTGLIAPCCWLLAIYTAFLGQSLNYQFTFLFASVQLLAWWLYSNLTVPTSLLVVWIV